MGTTFFTRFRCMDSKRILSAIGTFALIAFLLGITPSSSYAFDRRRASPDTAISSAVDALWGAVRKNRISLLIIRESTQTSGYPSAMGKELCPAKPSP